ncbi:MAG: VOC family protein [Acidimicrobiia bacterium]
MTTKTSQTIFPTLHYDDAPKAIEFLTEALGFTENARHENPDGTIAHAQLLWHGGIVMLSSAGAEESIFDLRPVCVYVVVDDVDEHHRRAAAAGAEVVMEPTDQDYGSRDYAVRDFEGNVWAFGTYRPELDAT